VSAWPEYLRKKMESSPLGTLRDGEVARDDEEMEV
jgi:hypothetical protein